MANNLKQYSKNCIYQFLKLFFIMNLHLFFKLYCTFFTVTSKLFSKVFYKFLGYFYNFFTKSFNL